MNLSKIRQLRATLGLIRERSDGDVRSLAAQALAALNEIPEADGVWAGLHVALDLLEEVDDDPEVVADVVALCGATDARREMVRDALRGGGWREPDASQDLRDTGRAGRVRSDEFERLTRRVAERMGCVAAAVPRGSADVPDGSAIVINGHHIWLTADVVEYLLARQVARERPPGPPQSVPCRSVLTLTDASGRRTTVAGEGVTLSVDHANGPNREVVTLGDRERPTDAISRIWAQARAAGTIVEGDPVDDWVRRAADLLAAGANNEPRNRRERRAAKRRGGR